MGSGRGIEAWGGAEGGKEGGVRQGTEARGGAEGGREGGVR